MERKGSAEWRGGLKGGAGMVSSGSGAVRDVAYSFSKRFEEEPGTNPEELIAAAHAACFSMALSAKLEGAGHAPESVATTATVTLEKTDAGFTVTRSHLDTVARAPGLDQAKFSELADEAKRTCPVSRLLNAEITMSARLG